MVLPDTKTPSGPFNRHIVHACKKIIIMMMMEVEMKIKGDVKTSLAGEEREYALIVVS